MELEDTFAQLTDNDHPLSRVLLSELSTLGPTDTEKLTRLWPTLPLERRHAVVSELVNLAEDNIEFDFSPLFYIALGDEEEGVRAAAIEGLWEDESRTLLNKLLKIFEDDPATIVRATAAQALGRFAYRAEIGKLADRWKEKLKGALIAAVYNEDESIDVRRRAIEAVAYFAGDDEIEDMIEEAYKDDDESMRSSAVRAMGHNLNERWEQIVKRELSNGIPQIRFEAIRASGEMGLSATVPQLATIIQNDSDIEVRLMAVWSLGQIGGGGPSRILRSLTQSDNEISEAAQEALDELNYAAHPLDMEYKVRDILADKIEKSNN